ncbi:MAG: hypothetical protein K9I37_06900 [Crocinitomicaceae bacterium]|nr:hypothetical protein [Crocinitomicaceae bacterium]
MKKLVLFMLLMSNISFAQNNLPKLGDVKVVNAKLTEVAYGDMSTYIMFENVISNSDIEEYSFAYWSWEPGEGSVVTEMENFEEGDYGKNYKLTLKYSSLEELEYQGFDIGNVETGRFYNDWVLIKIE